MLKKLLSSRGDYIDCPWNAFEVVLEGVKTLRSGRLGLQVSDSSGTGLIYCTETAGRQISQNGKKLLGRRITIRGFCVSYTPKDIGYAAREDTKIIAHEIREIDADEDAEGTYGIEDLTLST